MPSGDIPVRCDVELEQGGRTVEARTDSEVDDGERSDDVIAVLKLPVEYREEPGKPRMRIGDDARIVAGCCKIFGLMKSSQLSVSMAASGPAAHQKSH